MQELGEILRLAAVWQKVPLCPFLKKISKIEGDVRNKQVTIFRTQSGQSQRRIVAQIQLQTQNPVSFYTTKRRLGYSFLKVIARDIVYSHDPILDRKLIFRCNQPDFANELFQYEEICEKFDKLFSGRFNTGVLTFGKASIFYYETVGFLTEARRARFEIAIDLMCDLLDVLYFYNKGTQC